MPSSFANQSRSVGINRALWSCAAAFLGLLLLSFYSQPVGWLLTAGVTAGLACAIVYPYQSILVLAALGPLAEILLVLTGANSTGVRLSEALVLAFLAGWALRHAYRPRPLGVSPWLGWAVAFLVALTLASVIVQEAVVLSEESRSISNDLLALFSRDYLVSASPLSGGMLLVEGVLLLLAAKDVCFGDRGRQDSLARMLVAGAAAAASFNVVRLAIAAAEHEHAWATFARYFATIRLNVHYSDVNAAGSYFALLLPVAVSLVTRVRAFAVICTLLISAGLWMTGSRTAFVATLGAAFVAGMAALYRRPHSRAPVVATLALVVIASAALFLWYPHRTNTASGWWSLGTRIQFATAALRVTAEHPLFGAGIGGFYRLSGEYLEEMLAAQNKTHENAHNYFLQIAADLGLSGLVVFVAVLVLAIRPIVRAAAGERYLPQAVLTGVAAFLVTCLTGHPLLVNPVAYPFWMVLGVVSAPDAAAPRLDRRVRIAGVTLLFALGATVPSRVTFATSHANLEHRGVGLSIWQRTPEGMRYRWASGRSAFYVRSSARRISIPLRSGPDAPQTIEVRIFLDGREADRVVLNKGDDWRAVRVLPARRVDVPFSTISLQVGVPGTDAVIDTPHTESSGLLMVGWPSID